MKIAFVLDERWDSALTYYAHVIAEVFSERHDVSVICLDSSFIDLVSPLSKCYISPLRKVGLFGALRGFFRMWRCFSAIEPEVVFVIRGDAMFFSCLLKERIGFRLVRVFGEDRVFESNCPDAVLFPSDGLRRKYEGTSPAFVVKGFVDTGRFMFSGEGRERIRKEFGIGDSVLVGSVGRLDPVKGYENMIRAVGMLDGVKLMIVGEEKGVKVAFLEELSRRVGVEDRVVFVPERREDIVDIMSAFDIGVVPSVGSEVIARVVFEFMAIGMPIVCSDVGILSEVIDEGFSEIAKPDPGSLAAAIGRILGRDMEQMRVASRKASIFYSVDRFRSISEELLECIVGGSNET